LKEKEAKRESTSEGFAASHPLFSSRWAFASCV